MIKFILAFILYLNICLHVKCKGSTDIKVKIKNDWKVKREFIYLKNVELNERFVLIMNGRNKFFKLELDSVNNVFIAKVNGATKYSSQLKRKIIIKVANNEIVQKFLPNLEKLALLNNNFVKKDKSYQTSIIKNIGINENNLELKENIKKELIARINNYEDLILSSYRAEINLISYKIELLEKQKVEIINVKYLVEELKNIENKISK
uniref:Uncharacterized protein n=1 Tax=Meloidogyne enterolobii TaxID=390850 RepID=A0A6V7V610_MELEN|nr:unnamed protein product [Meloidogyne enterolobii]